MAAALVAGLLGAPTITAAAHADVPGVQVNSLVGGGSLDGTQATAQPFRTWSAGRGADGTLYFPDFYDNRIRAVAADGSLSTLAGDSTIVDGGGGFAGDGGPAAAAQLNRPKALISTPAGDVYFVDSGGYRVRRIDHTSKQITTVAGSGATEGQAVESPDATTPPILIRQLAFDGTTGAVAMLDARYGVVWGLLPDGSLSRLAGGGSTGTKAQRAYLSGSTAITYTADGDLLVAASPGTIRRIHAGEIDTVVGHNASYGATAGLDGASAYESALPGIYSLAAAPDGTIYAGTYDNETQQTYPYVPAAPRTFTIGGQLGTLSAAPCAGVAGITDTGRLMLSCDSVYLQQPDGSFTRIAGNGSQDVSGPVVPDGTPAADALIHVGGAVLGTPGGTLFADTYGLDRVGSDGLLHHFSSLTSVQGLAAGPQGGVYALQGGILDRVAADGTWSTVAGSGKAAPTDGLPAAQLPSITALAASSSGDAYAGVGSAVVLIRASDATTHVVVPAQRTDTGGYRAVVPEVVRGLAVRPDGTLLVLSSRNESTTQSVLRQVDPSSGASSIVYEGPYLAGITETSDGSTFVTGDGPLGGGLVWQLGQDGSLTRIAGGGHILKASQNSDELWIGNAAMGVASDGGLLLGVANRVLELHPVPVTPQPAVTDLTATPGTDGTFTNATLSWTLPAGLGTDSSIVVVSRNDGEVGPVAREGGILDTALSSTTTQTVLGTANGIRSTYSAYVLNAHGDVSPPTTVVAVAPGDTTAPSGVDVSELWSLDGRAILTLTRWNNDDMASVDVQVGAGTSPPGGPPASTGLTTRRVLTGLTAGSTYSVVVTARDYSGNTTASRRGQFVAGMAPSARIATGPSEGAWSAPDVTLSLTPTSSYASEYLTCRLDGAPLPAPLVCTDSTDNSYALTHLAAGTHTFTVQETTTLGSGPLVARSWRVDASAPTVSVRALPVVTLGPATLSWSHSDAGSGVLDDDVRYRRAAWNGGLSGYTQPASWQHLTAGTLKVPTMAGFAYCLSVRPRDRVGNLGGWSPDTCTEIPLDDRSLSASTGWTRSTSGAYYAGTITSTSRAGATLSRTGVQARRILVVATKCRGCGSIGVYWNGKLLGNYSLNASSTLQKQVISIADLGRVQAGTLMIKTLSAGKTYIDGVGLSRV